MHMTYINMKIHVVSISHTHSHMPIIANPQLIMLQNSPLITHWSIEYENLCFGFVFVTNSCSRFHHSIKSLKFYYWDE